LGAPCLCAPRGTWHVGSSAAAGTLPTSSTVHARRPAPPPSPVGVARGVDAADAGLDVGVGGGSPLSESCSSPSAPCESCTMRIWEEAASTRRSSCVGTVQSSASSSSNFTRYGATARWSRVAASGCLSASPTTVPKRPLCAPPTATMRSPAASCGHRRHNDVQSYTRLSELCQLSLSAGLVSRVRCVRAAGRRTDRR
jgi:hypothetical protein